MKIHIVLNDGTLIDTITRVEVQECCLKVAERISKGEIVNGNSINSLNGMIDKFTNLNFVGDRKIEEELNSVHPETPVFRGKDTRSDYHLVEKTLWQSQ
jgi:hypothetical protein